MKYLHNIKENMGIGRVCLCANLLTITVSYFVQRLPLSSYGKKSITVKVSEYSLEPVMMSNTALKTIFGSDTTTTISVQKPGMLYRVSRFSKLIHDGHYQTAFLM